MPDSRYTAPLNVRPQHPRPGSRERTTRDVLPDFLDGHAPAAREIARYRECCIGIISWLEVMADARTHPDEDVRRGFLAHFRIVPLTAQIAEEAVKLREEYRLKLPDAVIWASAISENCLLVSRNTKDSPAGQPGVRFPYRR